MTFQLPMPRKSTLYSPTYFFRWIKAFRKRERRDSMYHVATYLVTNFLNQPAMLTDGLGVLLLTWNQAFYRYGSFDFKKLEKCLIKNKKTINHFRNRKIFSISDGDKIYIKKLFNELLKSLEITQGKKKHQKSPVATAKALHLLAPDFFPLWDQRISNAYGYNYTNQPAEKYFAFCLVTKDLAAKLKKRVPKSELKQKTLLKLIDECNYDTYTKKYLKLKSDY